MFTGNQGEPAINIRKGVARQRLFLYLNFIHDNITFTRYAKAMCANIKPTMK